MTIRFTKFNVAGCFQFNTSRYIAEFIFGFMLSLFVSYNDRLCKLSTSVESFIETTLYTKLQLELFMTS